MTLPIVYLTGSSYEQGLQHGMQLRERIRHNLDVYFERFRAEGGVERAEVLARAQRYATAIAADNPSYDAGMRGIALGAEVSYEEIVALNVRYEILYYQYALKHMAAHDGCTAFALSPEMTELGHLLLGQNWDWIPDVLGALLHTTEENGFQTLAFTEAGIFGGKIGLNSAGLGLVINGITTTADDWTRLSKPFHLRCYEILQQRSLDDAVEVIVTGNRACSANFLIAQPPDRAVDLEAAPDVVNQIEWQDGCLVHANHFVDPEGLGVLEPADEFLPFSCKRQERLEALLRQQQPVTLAAIMDYLQDHRNAPRSICRHEDRSAPVDEQYRTVGSVIMDLDEQVMLISDGPPCENDYKQFALNRNY